MKVLNRKIKSFTLAMGATVLIPFTPADWTQLKYSSIPSNSLEFSPAKQMIIEVKESASPIFHKLEKPVSIKKLSVSGEIFGMLNLRDRVQGKEGADDFTVRIGLVLKGKKTLNFAQKLIAPKWINDLYKLAGDSSGVDHIEFINIASQELSWTKRIHPLSDLLHEEIVLTRPTGRFDIVKQFNSPREVVAIWLSSDGDDTKSRYRLRLDRIELKDK